MHESLDSKGTWTSVSRPHSPSPLPSIISVDIKVAEWYARHNYKASRGYCAAEKKLPPPPNIIYHRIAFGTSRVCTSCSLFLFHHLLQNTDLVEPPKALHTYHIILYYITLRSCALFPYHLTTVEPDSIHLLWPAIIMEDSSRDTQQASFEAA